MASVVERECEGEDIRKIPGPDSGVVKRPL